jgi:hypothetical protein
LFNQKGIIMMERKMKKERDMYAKHSEGHEKTEKVHHEKNRLHKAFTAHTSSIAHEKHMKHDCKK